MTFLEAAIEILRNAPEPLHFGEIARQAVEQKLLSHVGRDPEAAMKSCLTSAARGGDDALIERSKPGYYQIRPGAKLPAPPAAPAAAALPAAAKPAPAASAAAPASRASAAAATRTASAPSPAKAASPRAAAAAEAAPAEAPAGDAPAAEAPASAAPAASGGEGRRRRGGTSLEFEAPAGSGLDGVTDVAIVMANAMSRIVDERPELRPELEAIQRGGAGAPSPAAERGPRDGRELGGREGRDGRESRDGRDPRDGRDSRESREGRDNREARPQGGGGGDRGPKVEVVRSPLRGNVELPSEDRGGRRKRRRRRKPRRLEWGEGGARMVGQRDDDMQELLDKVQKVLEDAGPRSLHVRQIAEQLGQQGVLGGEISEIERAVTTSVLLDVHRRGDRSPFVVRGDARYQARSTRVPQAAAEAEKAFRVAALNLETETRSQLSSWLGSLGPRALEAICRVAYQLEGASVVATLPPGRGVARFVIEGGPESLGGGGEEDDRRTLVVVLPRKASPEPKAWEVDAEKLEVNHVVVISLGENQDSIPQEIQTLTSDDLTEILARHGVGVRRLRIDVPVLDPALLESIGGLDT